MNTKYKHRFFIFTLSFLFLTGCPGSGDRLKADETAMVIRAGENICFEVPNAANYQPSLIAINPRGTPPKALSATDSPNLVIKDGKLCLPPDFYHFTGTGQYIVQYILKSSDGSSPPRSVVTGIQFSNGEIRNIPLSDSETTR